MNYLVNRINSIDYTFYSYVINYDIDIDILVLSSQLPIAIDFTTL